MIIHLHKFLIFGAKKEVDHFFDLSQNEGYIEFIVSTQRKKEVPESLKKFLSAIKVLRKEAKVEIPEERAYIPMEPIAERVVELYEELEKLRDEERSLRAEIARVAPFGDFSLEDLSYLEKEGKRIFQFFCLKTGKEVVIPQELIFLGTEYDLDYFISIQKERIFFPAFIEVMIEKPVGKLKERLREVLNLIAQREKGIKLLAGYLRYLQEALILRLNKYHLEAAKEEVQFPMEGEGFFSIEAWVPDSKITDFETFLHPLAVEYSEISVEKIDRIPTCMENKGWKKMGEDLVNIYDTPAPVDKDPSSWIFWAFVIFYGMITADAGYGLLYLLLGLILRWYCPAQKPFARRFQRLIRILGISCIAWGFLTASFFGIDIPPNHFINRITPFAYFTKKKADYLLRVKSEVYDSWEKKYPAIAKVKNGEEFLLATAKMERGKQRFEAFNAFKNHILMEFSLLVGVLHISLGSLRYLRRYWAHLGWVFFILGGYLYFPFILKATSLVVFMKWISPERAFSWGFHLLYGGAVSALLLAIVQFRLRGVREIFRGVEVFSDVLSYLRIYALGLAAVIMADTFNAMGKQAGWFFGFFIILMGHGINIILAIMGGIIHGLRLNFIEWYHYCFTGNGKLFNPLRKL